MTFCNACGKEMRNCYGICVHCGAGNPAVTLATRRCPFCAEEMNASAIKCKHCGEILDGALRTARMPKAYNPGTAAALSFFIPGLGQIYKGEIGHGFLWLFAVFAGYCAVVIPGFILHLLCIGNAYKGVPHQSARAQSQGTA